MYACIDGWIHISKTDLFYYVCVRARICICEWLVCMGIYRVQKEKLDALKPVW